MPTALGHLAGYGGYLIPLGGALIPLVVMIAARDGVQVGFGQYARLKIIPPAARRSRFGVSTWGWS